MKINFILCVIAGVIYICEASPLWLGGGQPSMGWKYGNGWRSSNTGGGFGWRGDGYNNDRNSGWFSGILGSSSGGVGWKSDAGIGSNSGMGWRPETGYASDTISGAGGFGGGWKSGGGYGSSYGGGWKSGVGSAFG